MHEWPKNVINQKFLSIQPNKHSYKFFLKKNIFPLLALLDRLTFLKVIFAAQNLKQQSRYSFIYQL